MSEYCVTVATERLRQDVDSPVGRSYTFERTCNGKVYTHCGVVPVVDGETCRFYLDDGNLHSIRDAEADVG